jgi:peptidoglycan/LPS O-acetylase OafA/YrhL
MAIPTKSGFNIPSLDGIRALAFSIVFLAHAGLGRLIPGGFGVTIFFFLSGYLITTLLRKEFGQTGRIHLRQFYLRRVLRIFPPFYITLTILVIVTLLGLLPGELAVGPIAAQAAFMTNYYPIFVDPAPKIPAGSEVFWSLAVEEHFYVIFPFLAIFLLARLTGRARAAILGVACLGFLAWRCILVFYFHEGEFRTYPASDTRMDSILFGCILALWGNPAIDPPLRLTPRSKLAIYGASLGLIGFCLGYRDPRFRETFRYTLQGIALIPMFYFAVAEPDRPWFRWLNWRWIRFFGILSYSLYLIHFSALKMVPYLLPGLNQPIQATLSLALSLSYSLGLYYSVERPLARLRKRLHSDPRPPSADPEPDADPEASKGLIAALPDAP